VSALADALVAAQRRALSAVEKAYLAGKASDDELRLWLDGIGATDKIDQDRLITSLTVIRTLGASLPGEPTNGAEKAADEPMTDAQRTFIDKLWSDRNDKTSARPDLEGLTKAKASELITQLKTNTYNVDDWSIPF
jgi:hypothetical protein